MRHCPCRPEETCGGNRCGIAAFLDEFYARPDAFPRPPQGTLNTGPQMGILLRAYYARPATNNPDGRCRTCARTVRQEIDEIQSNLNAQCDYANQAAAQTPDVSWLKQGEAP